MREKSENISGDQIKTKDIFVWDLIYIGKHIIGNVCYTIKMHLYNFNIFFLWAGTETNSTRIHVSRRDQLGVRLEQSRIN